MHVEVLGHRAGHRELQERAHGPGPVSTQPRADPREAGLPRELGSDRPGEAGTGPSSSTRMRHRRCVPAQALVLSSSTLIRRFKSKSSGNGLAGGVREQRGRVEQNPGGRAGPQEPLCPEGLECLCSWSPPRDPCPSIPGQRRARTHEFILAQNTGELKTHSADLETGGSGSLGVSSREQ